MEDKDKTGHGNYSFISAGEKCINKQNTRCAQTQDRLIRFGKKNTMDGKMQEVKEEEKTEETILKQEATQR